MGDFPHAGHYSGRSDWGNDKIDVMTEKVTGPASYFPSIEKTYGHPMQYWFDLVENAPVSGHMKLVNWLKTEHGMGHGHANAVVGYVSAQKGEKRA